MRDEYDFSQAKKNPYASKLKSKHIITISLDDEAMNYFKQLSEKMDVPYQTLINLYLKDCATEHRKPSVQWQ